MSPPRIPSDAHLRGRFHGCLLGGAVGDALGAPVEFLDLEEIVMAYGEGGIRDFAPAYGKLGSITDDTQMTLFTAEGMLSAQLASALGGQASVFLRGNGFLRALADDAGNFPAWFVRRREFRLASAAAETLQPTRTGNHLPFRPAFQSRQSHAGRQRQQGMRRRNANRTGRHVFRARANP